MSYHFVVTGLGICVGNITNHEDFIESMITEKQTKRKRPKDALTYAIKTALKYTDNRPVLVVSDEIVTEETLAKFGISQQRKCSNFADMIKTAVTVFQKDLWNHVLLISKNKEGCIAVLLSQSAERHFVQVEIEPENSTDSKIPVMDAIMEFVKNIIQVRFSMRFDDSGENEIYLWYGKEKRELTENIDGIKLKIKEAKLVNKPIFKSKQYLIPVMFDTIEEAKEKLLHLQESAMQKGLFWTMQIYVEAFKEKRKENTIVFLVKDRNTLKTQTNELLAQSNRLLDEGFYWKSKTGSLYIRHNTKDAKIVFMNPPGGMFNSKVFHRFAGKLFDFVDENSIYESENRIELSKNAMLNNYLSEITITYVSMFLLETIGIKPNYLSGASMGEMAFYYFILESEHQSDEEFHGILPAWRSFERIMRRILEETNLQEERYFKHKINLAKYYLKFDAEKVKEAIKNYDDVFIIIEGSPKDVIVCGEKKSCEKLFQQLGCIAKLLDEPTYVHTPVIESEYENIRKEVLACNLHLNLKDKDYKILSTHFGRYMDETYEMFAENIATIITKPVNYTKAVETLYEEGARVFIDISTTQLCGSWGKVILEGKPDAQIVSIYEEKDTAEYLLNLCTVMLAGNVSFDFEKMYSRLEFVEDVSTEDADMQNASQKVLTEETNHVEIMPEMKISTETVIEKTEHTSEENTNTEKVQIQDDKTPSVRVVEKVEEVKTPSVRATQKVTENIHEKDVRNNLANSNNTESDKLQTNTKMQNVSQNSIYIEANIQEEWNAYLRNQMKINQKAYEMYVQAENQLFAQALASFENVSSSENSISNEITNKVTVADKTTVVSTTPSSNKNYLWDRAQILEMTENSMASVLGEQYKEVDKYPVRARMPLPPFLFATRIISIDAEFGKLRPSQIVAEYDIDEDCVFRRGDVNISPLLASEASHIGIFLMGYIGLDVMSNGTLSYRALDSEETCYSNRPFRVGDVMKTVFTVHKFVQNGSTTIISFTFETYNGEELISTCEAVGGFFTKAELASNKGIVTPKRLLQKVEPKELLHFGNNKRTSYTEKEVRAFFDGNYQACFGNEVTISLKDKYYIPVDMKMIERVTNIDYNGGKYGRGLICGERNITPDMWPFKAHFKNDPVFPGIIMIDGALQLAIFLMAHTGMLGYYDNAYVVTRLNSSVKSKFRGQVRKAHSILRYQVHIKEAEQREDGIHFVMDVGIFNDDVQVIQIEHFTFRIFGDPK